MIASVYQDIKNNLRELYLEDARPWLVGFSGGKDSTMLASLVFDAVLSVPAENRKKSAWRGNSGRAARTNESCIS